MNEETKARKEKIMETHGTCITEAEDLRAQVKEMEETIQALQESNNEREERACNAEALQERTQCWLDEFQGTTAEQTLRAEAAEAEAIQWQADYRAQVGISVEQAIDAQLVRDDPTGQMKRRREHHEAFGTLERMMAGHFSGVERAEYGNIVLSDNDKTIDEQREAAEAFGTLERMASGEAYKDNMRRLAILQMELSDLVGAVRQQELDRRSAEER